MTKSDEQMSPSLLEDESRGGDISEGGISFQAGVVTSHIPRWLAMEGFTAMVREAIFDAEAKFFVPGRGTVMEAVEVKDHSVTRSDFWKEIDRFKNVDVGSPGSYQWFTLASTGLSRDLHPLRNSLRRIRGPYGFYRDNLTILDNSFRGYVKRVTELGRTEGDARFLYNRVLLIDDLSPNRKYAKPLFTHELYAHLPYHRNMVDHTLESIYDHLATFVQSRRNETITRKELEDTLRAKAPADLLPPVQPIRVYVAMNDSEVSPGANTLWFAWQPFFGGEARSYRPPEVWNLQMLGELRETKDWILANRYGRRIHVSGTYRLSTAFAIGYTFSAVSGFSIDMDYRGTLWPTDNHAVSETPDYPLHIAGSYRDTRGERLVVSIGIIRDIVKDVEANLEQHGLNGMPTLHIQGDNPITSSQQANLLAKNIKQHVSVALATSGARQIALFIAGPAYVPLFLGHRFNATAAIQCYEQSGTGGYVPTCRLA